MRGFRASRAVQNNKSARFGRHEESPHGERDGHFDEGNSKSPPNTLRLRLPDWLRMPALRPASSEREPNVIPITRAKKRVKAVRAPVTKTTRKVRASPAGTGRKRKAA